MSQLLINDDAYLEITNIARGAFQPLTGFMTAPDYRGVVDEMTMADGTVWSLPITLDVPPEQVSEVERAGVMDLVTKAGAIVGRIRPHEVFEVDRRKDGLNVFGTSDENHPGLARELARSRFRVGGPVEVLQESVSDFPAWDLTPAETRAYFLRMGWKRIASFQTRNPPHRAHEYLQRTAMEVSDGIFIQPLIGWKKPGDFTPEAIMGSYRLLTERFYPGNVVLGTLRTPMRYAGPREAVFHAIVRRNYGCTAFIVGRDHAGVGAYYGKYEAQQLACSLEKKLGIAILPLAGPRYCMKCECISTERTCGHPSDCIADISGTAIRTMLVEGIRPDERFMRKEIADYLIALAAHENLFCHP